MKLKNNKKAKLIILIISCIVVILLFGIILILNFKDKYEYGEYEEKINIYGLNKLYNNESNNPNENVTKIEALKLAICSTKNTLEIEELILNTEGKNEEEKILNYSYSIGITTPEEVNIKNINKSARYMDIIQYISKAKYYLLGKEYSSTDTINLSDYKKYNDNEKIYILDLLSEDIIENSKYRLNAYKALKKGLCNRIIIKYINKYNLLSILGRTIVTDEKNLPSNSNDYPYIVSDVDKEVYEQSYKVEQEKEFLNPADFYTYRKDYYISTIKTAEDYFNSILNISYKDISYDDLHQKLQNLVVGNVEDVELNKYVQYVKNNKISISGKATAQIPCIYNDGGYCRIRMKLEFEVKEANTKENLLYMDNIGKTKIYDKNNYTVYIDAKMGYVFGSKQVYVSQESISSMLLDISKNEIKTN